MAEPLTYEQQFIYGSITQWGHNTGWNHLSYCARLSGRLDPACFELAVTETIRANDIVSLRLGTKDGAIVQNTVPTTARECFELLGTGSGANLGADPIPLLTAALGRQFDLTKDAPVRFYLLLTASESYVLIVAHHVFTDRRGLALLWKQLLDRYADLRDNSAPAGQQDRAEGTYLEYALSQRQRIDDGLMQSDAKLHVGRLQAAEPLLSFRDRPANPRMSATQGFNVEVEPELTAALRRGGRELRVTGFTQFAVATLQTMYDMSAQDELLLAVVIDMRRPPFARTVGQFADLALVRERASDRASLIKQLRNVQEQVSIFMQHPVPSSYLMDALPWLGERRRSYGVGDVFIDYVRDETDLRHLEERLGCDLQPVVVPITEAMNESRLFDGCAVAFLVHEGTTVNRMRLQYETAFFSETDARDIAATWLERLSRLAR
jgi:Condensation domain